MSVVEHECDFPDTCSVCRGPARGPVDRLSVVAVFWARFSGYCGECDLGTSVGERLARLSDGRYVHAHCAETFR